MLRILTGILVSYLVGSIPTAYIFGRVLKGVDIRKFGSGNVGATNALRVLGKGPGIAVLLLDMFKGFAAVTFLGNLILADSVVLSSGALRLILGFACIAGHNWTVFLKFKGGKGVATTLGVLAGLAAEISALKLVLGLVLLTWLLVFLTVRIVSLASVICAVSLPIYMLLFEPSILLITAGFILSVFIVWRHKSNIRRILKNEEPRLKFKSRAS